MNISFANVPMENAFDGRSLLGFNIIENTLLVERDRQVRFPKSKKRRIRKKWSAKDKNWSFKPITLLVGTNTIHCHPEIARQLRKEVVKL